MEVVQIYKLVNDITRELIGEDVILKEDLSNVVDIGNAVFNANAMDNYVRKLVDHIGKVVFVNRPYSGGVPSVVMDDWEFGSVVEKIDAELPDASENESWELQDGVSYDENIFTAPKVRVKFFNSKVTFEVALSFTELQVKSAFSNATQLNSFLSMLYEKVDTKLTIALDGLIMRTINNFIGEVVQFGKPSQNINLLAMYNQDTGNTLTTLTALTDKEFIRYASMKIGVMKDRIARASTLFNIEGATRYTSYDRLRIVLLSDFKRATDSYLQADTFNNEFTRLPDADIVPYWQGSGVEYAFNDIASINVIVKNPTTGEPTDVYQENIIGIMFDKDALGVNNANRRITSKHNAKAEFFNNWYKSDGSYFNDLSENFIVFYMAD